MKPMHAKPRRGWYWVVISFFLGIAAIVVTVLIISVISALVQQHNLNKTVSSSTADELVSKAVVQQENGDLTGAEASLEAAMLKEEKPDYESQLAVVKYRLKKYQEAITEYQKLVSAKQDVAFAWNGIGNAYRDWAASETANRTQRETSALDAYTQATTADPGYVAAYINEALLLSNMGKNEDALAVAKDGSSKTQVKQLQDLVSQLEH